MASTFITQSHRRQVTEIGAQLAGAQHALIEAVVALDESGEWAADGAVTCAHWIADHLDIEVCTAREWLRIGKLLRTLPVIAQRFADRKLSYSKVRALTRVATAENEAELGDIAERTPASRFSHALAAWLNLHTVADETARRQHQARSVRHRLDPDGMTTFTVRLPPLMAGTLLAAIDTTLLRNQQHAAAEAKQTGTWPSIAQQRADALIAAITHPAKLNYEVVVHVRGDGCTLDDGTPVNDRTVAGLIDHAFIRALIHDADRRPINASARRRHPTPRQQRVVHERHHGRCVDCGTTDLIEYDHQPAYETSKRTTTDELEPRCAPCHHRRHRLVRFRSDFPGGDPSRPAIRDRARRSRLFSP
jgi:hypothetical protein